MTIVNQRQLFDSVARRHHRARLRDWSKWVIRLSEVEQASRSMSPPDTWQPDAWSHMTSSPSCLPRGGVVGEDGGGGVQIWRCSHLIGFLLFPRGKPAGAFQFSPRPMQWRHKEDDVISQWRANKSIGTSAGRWKVDLRTKVGQKKKRKSVWTKVLGHVYEVKRWTLRQKCRHTKYLYRDMKGKNERESWWGEKWTAKVMGHLWKVMKMHGMDKSNGTATLVFKL